MNPRLQRFSVLTGFSIVVAVLVLNTIVTRRQLGDQTDAEVWVRHTQHVRFELGQIELLLTNAETGQRGYLYTGDPQYLQPYDAAITQIDSHINNLSQLTADNPGQLTHLAALRQLAHAKLNELAQTIALYQAGKPDQAMSMVQSDRGLTMMDKLRNELGEMQQEESTLEAARLATYDRSIRITVACIYVTTLIAALGVVLLARFILHERAIREQHAHELKAREEWFRVTLTSIGDAVIATDARGKVTFLNPIAEGLTGIKLNEALGQNIDAVFPIFNEMSGKPAENPIKKVMDLGIVVGLANHTVLKHRDGHLTAIEDSAAPIRDDRGQTVGMILVFHDVTAERNSQEVLRKTEKLAAAARLSATVAHEINNPLEAVVNLIFLAKMMPDTTPALREQLELVEHELDRVAHLTRQTLGFYRDSSQPENVQLEPVIQSVLRLYGNKIATREIQVECKFSDCPPIWGMAGEMKQVVSNLIANAIDAVPSGGHIRVQAGGVQTAEGTAAELIVEDDGPGIGADNARRIFDPFFTTKLDVGTGLGLWVTREIVGRHGGTIELCTNGAANGGLKGAAFLVHIPCSVAEPPAAPSAIN